MRRFVGYEVQEGFTGFLVVAVYDKGDGDLVGAEMSKAEAEELKARLEHERRRWLA